MSKPEAKEKVEILLETRMSHIGILRLDNS